MKIVFAGTPDFATEHLKMVIGSHHEISCVLTQPDRKSGRGKKVKFSPVKELALHKNIPVFQPANLREEDTLNMLKKLEPDLVLVVAYGLLIPKKILDIPKHGCINVHASILPKWRGASPMEYCLLNGDKKSGISYMQMSEGLDEGPVFQIHECVIEIQDNLRTLEEKLIGLSEKNLCEFLNLIESESIEAKNQNDNEASFAPKITKEMLQIDWAEDAKKIISKINAFYSKYGAYFLLGDKRIKIHKAREYKHVPNLKPGHIESNDDGMIIFCKSGSAILIEDIQMEGKNIVSGQEFISAYRDIIEDNK